MAYSTTPRSSSGTALATARASRSGLPPVSRASVGTHSCSSTWSPCAARNAAVSCSSNERSGTITASRSSSTSRRRVSLGTSGSSSRRVSMITHRSIVRTRKRTSRSAAASARWASSSTIASGASAVRLPSRLATAAKRLKRSASMADRCGSSLSMPAASRPPSSASTAVHGHSGGAPPSGQLRPQATVNPSAAARPRACPHSVVLPIPAGPLTMSSWLRPSRAAMQASAINASSRARPTKRRSPGRVAQPSPDSTPQGPKWVVPFGRLPANCELSGPISVRVGHTSPRRNRRRSGSSSNSSNLATVQRSITFAMYGSESSQGRLTELVGVARRDLHRVAEDQPAVRSVHSEAPIWGGGRPRRAG